MWEHIRVIDYEKLEREREEALRERDETTHRAEEAAHRLEEAVRKLLELGVSREQLVKEGILK